MNKEVTPTDDAGEPLYVSKELQPESNNSERAALTEREDGTVREGTIPSAYPRVSSGIVAPLMKLTEDEEQSVDELAEYRASSEREDGTNTG